jgi:hypothetical protein
MQLNKFDCIVNEPTWKGFSNIYFPLLWALKQEKQEKARAVFLMQ